MRRQKQGKSYREGYIHRGKGRVGDEWGWLRAPLCWARLAGWAGGCVGAYSGLPKIQALPGCGGTCVTQRAHLACYLTAGHCTGAGSRGPAQRCARPAAQF